MNISGRIIKEVRFDDDVSEFLGHSNYIEQEYSYEAFMDAKDAWNFLSYFAYIDLDIIRMVHHILLRNLNPTIAGKFRTQAVWVGGRECPSHALVENSLSELVNKIPHTEDSVKQWHLVFEKIHPFLDGNGRTGRIIMNWQRKNLGLPILIIHEGKEQQEYYKWFKDAELAEKELETQLIESQLIQSLSGQPAWERIK